LKKVTLWEKLSRSRRPLGSKLEAGWWKVEDFSWVRGFNYVPSYATSDVQAWLEYDSKQIDRELELMWRIRCNSIRFFLQYDVYKKDPDLFLHNLEDLLSRCEKYEMTAMPILWDACFGEDPTLESKDHWVANPGPKRVADRSWWPKGEEYVKAIVESHVGDRRILMWDIMNEPSGRDFDFVKHFCHFVKKLDSTHPITVGHSFAKNNKGFGDIVDVLSYHPYGFSKNFQIFTSQVKEIAAQAGGKPILATEIGLPGECQPYETGIKMCEEADIGFYLALVMVGRVPPYMFSLGYFYKDETIRRCGPVTAFLGLNLKEDTAPDAIPLDDSLDEYKVWQIIDRWNPKHLGAHPEEIPRYEMALRWLAISIAWAGVTDKRLEEIVKLHKEAEEVRKSDNRQLFIDKITSIARIARVLAKENNLVPGS